MPSEAELIAERNKKLKELISLNINPYPYSFEKSHSSKDINEEFSKLKKEEHGKKIISTAGRIISLRRMGKVTFAHLLDEWGKVQIYLQEDTLGQQNYKILKHYDIGDWIGVEGNIFRTKTGETTVNVKKHKLLCKSLRPLPEKWHGLKDIEQRYRHRYVDLIINSEVREVFKKRTLIIDAIRNYLNKKGFTEVDTPCLQPIYGGAAARPFKSHLNALDMDIYLRISNELYLKRLIVGGFEKVYEFARDFRNEDIDRTHNPEFTQVELYQAYADFNNMMEIMEDVYVEAAKRLYNTAKIEYQGNEINLKKPWQKLTMVESIKKYADINVENLSDRELFDLRTTFNLEKVEGDLTRGKIIQALFEEVVEGNLVQPTFITHHPVESTPLCKPCRKHPQYYVERFEPFICGMEIGNAYSELNDPLLQRKLLELQAKELSRGKIDAHPLDEDFIRAIEYGMPPTGGLGIGIDRMVMILTNQPSIRDVLLFPFMK